jgi:menaquinone-dependent protoporphyrinogen oxidase
MMTKVTLRVSPMADARRARDGRQWQRHAGAERRGGLAMIRILVAYATRHGSTRGIAERIAVVLERLGYDADLQPIDRVTQVDGYDAFVIGSAAYMNHWLKEATHFVRRHQAVLAERPVWLFSSGPIGIDKVDKQGTDVLISTRPREFAELAMEINPRGLQVFFGAYDPDAPAIGIAERLMSITPARKALPAGDFRDWTAIEAWATEIGGRLDRLLVATR